MIWDISVEGACARARDVFIRLEEFLLLLIFAKEGGEEGSKGRGEKMKPSCKILRPVNPSRVMFWSSYGTPVGNSLRRKSFYQILIQR